MRLHRLLPAPSEDVEATAAYAHEPGTLRANMVSSLDGAAVLDGKVGALSGPVDFALLLLMRSLCDVLLVGAATVRAEGYGALRAAPRHADLRAANGQDEHPRLALLTRGLDLDLDSPAFTDSPRRPLVFTTSAAPEERLARAREHADVVVTGDATVDLSHVRHHLEKLGLTRILTEGGPRVLAELYAGDLVDELCLALSPVLVGGDHARVTDGWPLASPREARLDGLYQAEGFLFTRYRHDRLDQHG